MNRTIVTFGTGKHADYLNITIPTYKRFGERHGWDVLVLQDIPNARPKAWYKICALLAALENYDEALFLGADTIIIDGRNDLIVPDEYWQAMVFHHTGDGEVPNTDVWLCRKTMIPVLSKAWSMKEWLMHGWWEQAAIMDLMSYRVSAPAHLTDQNNELYKHTFRMDNSWNVHKWDVPQPENPRIQHATMWANRTEKLREWYEIAEKGWMNELYQPKE